jgi:hypothetical protein
MPRINLGGVDEARDFVPRGPYDCGLTKIDEMRSRKGDEMWRLEWTVDMGPHRGHLLLDWLPFSEAAMPRVKKLCFAVGIDTSGVADLTPNMFLGKRARVTVIVGEYETDSGERRLCNKVTWGGYDPPGPASAGQGRVSF